jgi:serine/threonine protein phosphatase PrpC
LKPHATFAAHGAVISHTGKVRARNEDAYLCGRMAAQGDLQQPLAFECPAFAPWIIAVADGLGGHQAGERASRHVVQRLGQCPDFTPEGVRKSLGDIHGELCEMGRNDPALTGLGAVIAGLCAGPAGLFVFSLGDARVYRQQDAFLAQITQDDSLANLRSEALDADGQQLRRATSNRLAQALGGHGLPRPIEPHFIPVRVAQAARFLICTDGLTDCVPLEQMEIMANRHQDPPALVQALLMKAMQAGASDNITLCASHVNRQEKSSTRGTPIYGDKILCASLTLPDGRGSVPRTLQLTEPRPLGSVPNTQINITSCIT